jgi:hypothetical protein
LFQPNLSNLLEKWKLRIPAAGCGPARHAKGRVWKRRAKAFAIFADAQKCSMGLSALNRAVMETERA